MTRPYAGQRYFLPVLVPMSRKLHPLMAWWAVLYALSMLARYEPASWVTNISVDNSQHAVSIERVLHGEDELAVRPRKNLGPITKLYVKGMGTQKDRQGSPDDKRSSKS